MIKTRNGSKRKRRRAHEFRRRHFDFSPEGISGATLQGAGGACVPQQRGEKTDVFNVLISECMFFWRICGYFILSGNYDRVLLIEINVYMIFSC